MAKLNNTSETVIAITFLVMNLSTWLRRIFLCVFMSSRPNNTCFEIEDKFPLYLKQIKAEKTYLKSSQRISRAPVFGLRSIIQQTLHYKCKLARTKTYMKKSCKQLMVLIEESKDDWYICWESEVLIYTTMLTQLWSGQSWEITKQISKLGYERI